MPGRNQRNISHYFITCRIFWDENDWNFGIGLRFTETLAAKLRNLTQVFSEINIECGLVDVNLSDAVVERCSERKKDFLKNFANF